MKEGIRVLEGLAASGLRAIRYAKEVPGIARVDANDLDPAVVDAMRRNVAFNGPEASSRVHPIQGDCRIVMMQVRHAFSRQPSAQLC
jgi:tRNA (guanine26-N2/guanine27-N2)-dimethyltransferase